MNIFNHRYDAACPISDLTPHPLNPREGDVGAICQSIEANGFYGAVIAQEGTGYILVGHHRLQAAVEEGADAVPVLWIDCDEQTANRILLADNHIADLAKYNEGALLKLLEGLRDETGNLYGTGFDDEDLDDLVMKVHQAPEEKPAGPESNAVGGDPDPEVCPRCGELFHV